MTVNDLQGRLLIAGLFEVLLYIFAAVDKTSSDIVHSRSVCDN